VVTYVSKQVAFGAEAMVEKDLLEIISKLRAKGMEWTTVDAKQELSLTGNGEKAEFVKDVTAMANNGEKSYIVIGLQDGTFADIGTLSNHYLKNNLNQLLEGKIDPPVIIDYQEFTVNGNEYGLVEIIGYNPPYIVARDFIANPGDRKQTKIYKGTIFIRHEDRTEGISRAELDELLKNRGIRKEFENETEYAQHLIFDHPYGWEYLLTAELLKSKLLPIKRRFADLQRGLVYRRTAPIQEGAEFIYWMRSKCDDLANLAQMAAKIIIEEIPASWGLPGVAGEPLEIRHAVDALTSVCNELVEWEADTRYVIAPSPFQSLKEKMQGWTSQFLDEVDSSSDKLTEIFKQPNPKGEYTIMLVFKEPGSILSCVENQSLVS